jgi:tRNA(Ile)-lysidine synthetase-like protein
MSIGRTTTGILNSIQRQFNGAFTRLWQDGAGRKGHIGLAISGGVDSMALAWLCREFQRNHHDAPKFTGFIVDHGVRDGSAIEASKVAGILKSLKIKAKVLKLDWSSSSNPTEYSSAINKPGAASNFETKARTLRYRALGQACYDAGIDSLVIAHHLNDQAETMLVRIHSGYNGDGLRGIQPEALLPENDALTRNPPNFQQGQYPDSHHHPSQLGDNLGPIKIFRPLLDFRKEDLIATCREAGVEWFEDHTNANKSLTIRNTVRHILNGDDLPKALQTKRLYQLATNVRAQTDMIHKLDEAAFEKVKISLKPSVGLATCEIDTSQKLAPEGDEALENHVRAGLVRRLLSLVSPTELISLQALDLAVDMIFKAGTANFSTLGVSLPIKAVVVAEVEIRDRTKAGTDSHVRQLTLCRTKSSDVKRSEADLHLSIPSHPEAAIQANDVLTQVQNDKIAWTSWHLFDHRYWIRVGRREFGDLEAFPMQSPPKIVIRLLNQKDLTQAAKAIKSNHPRQLYKKLHLNLRIALEAVPTPTIANTSVEGLRATLPAVFLSAEMNNNNNNSGVETDELLALPTLGWIRGVVTTAKNPADDPPQEWVFDWRYKQVELHPGNNPLHTIEGPESWTSAAKDPARTTLSPRVNSHHYLQRKFQPRRTKAV